MIDRGQSEFTEGLWIGGICGIGGTAFVGIVVFFVTLYIGGL